MYQSLNGLKSKVDEFVVNTYKTPFTKLEKRAAIGKEVVKKRVHDEMVLADSSKNRLWCWGQ